MCDGFSPLHYLSLMILTTADIPLRILYFLGSLLCSALSIDTLIGTRWVTFVKFPDALLGGISEKRDAVFDPTENTFPLNTSSGNASIVNLTSCPLWISYSFVSSR